MTADQLESVVEEIFTALLASLSGEAVAASASVSAYVRTLEEKLDGPDGVIRFLLRRVWPPIGAAGYDDDALSVLTWLVESRPERYMAPTAKAVRVDIDKHFVNPPEGGAGREVGDGLLLALSKLLVGPSGEDQVGIATDAGASLLALCKWDRDYNNGASVTERVLATINELWFRLRQEGRRRQRESSTSQMRIAALTIDVCLLGGDGMRLALFPSESHGGGIMDKLLDIALECPNPDPLLQVSALDQLERLTVDDKEHPATGPRAEFLLANDALRRGLLILAGSPGDLTRDASLNEEWGEADPINGGAALRLLTEICRVGVTSSGSVGEATRGKFQLLLSSFCKSLHNFHPRGELERLAYIYGVSSLIGSCAMVASSAPSAAEEANTVLSDSSLIEEWLSLHSRVSQPKLKATVLSSLSQVLEPSIWNGKGTSRPDDGIALRLCRAFGRANDGKDSIEMILGSAKSTFVEERLGAYSMLRALAMRGAGVRLLLLYNDGDGEGGDGAFVRWLLDRPEPDPEGKKAKYLLVDSMLAENGGMIGGLISRGALRRLEEWRQGGPNHTAATVPWETATQ